MEETVRQDDRAPDRYGRWALPLISAAAFALFVFGVLKFHFGSSFAWYFNSDSAVPVLLADEVLRTGRLLPATWYFANNEIWMLSPHVFAIPFVALFGASTFALKLANMSCLAAMPLFLALPLHRITRSWPYSIIVAAGVFSAFSGFQQMAVYSQTAYGWFTAEFAMLAWLAVRLQQDGPEAQGPFGRMPWTTALYAFILVNLAIESPLRAAAYWVAPVVAVTLFVPISKTRSRALAGLTIAAFIGGAVLHAAVSNHLLASAGLTASLLKPAVEWFANVATIARGVPTLVSGAHLPGAVPGALDAIRLGFFALAALVVLVAPAGNGPGSAECRFFARVSGLMLLAILAVMTIGRVTVDPSSDRYLLPPALLCLAAFMAILGCRLRERPFAIASFATLFAVAFCGGAVVLLRTERATGAAGCDAPAHICRLDDIIAKTGVRQGYASYWKANVSTVASKHGIRTCGVFLAPELRPFRWLVSKDCFDPPSDDRYFLALDSAEIEKAGRASLLRQAGTPIQTVTGGKYEVWIYTTANAKLDWLKR